MCRMGQVFAHEGFAGVVPLWFFTSSLLKICQISRVRCYCSRQFDSIHTVCARSKYSECSANKLSHFPSYLRQHNGAKQRPICEGYARHYAGDMNCDEQTV